MGKRKAVKITIAVRDDASKKGWKRVAPFAVGARSRGLAATQEKEGGSWSVTHVPTGHRFDVLFSTEAAANQAVRALASLATWSKLRTTDAALTKWCGSAALERRATAAFKAARNSEARS
jgi:hypothetical protein